ncbi:MAG: tRNA pseudouridine(38-40) synthase TruA [Thermodesulfobacteriota bacterium]
MGKNFRLVIEYDGSAYHGWQRQKDRRTIQGEIEKALSTITCRPVVLIGSGRTDAGVHALGQVANFTCDTDLTADIFHRGLNRMLPGDIVVHSCGPAEDSFHARYDAKSKTYRYHILNDRQPAAIGRQYVWQIRQGLDTEAMGRAARGIVGEHDFKAFEGSGSPRSSTIRNVLRTEVRQTGKMVFFEIEATGFLRYMVRNIVGTLVEVGLGKLSPRDFNMILDSRDRRNAGFTAPPRGLFLVAVAY